MHQEVKTKLRGYAIQVLPYPAAGDASPCMWRLCAPHALLQLAWAVHASMHQQHRQHRRQHLLMLLLALCCPPCLILHLWLAVTVVL